MKMKEGDHLGLCTVPSPSEKGSIGPIHHRCCGTSGYEAASLQWKGIFPVSRKTDELKRIEAIRGKSYGLLGATLA